MDVRHAAALALVGWYLMFRSGLWARPFDSSKDCLAEQHEQEREYSKLEREAASKEEKHNYQQQFLDSASARCIATDDPRLKDK